MGKKNLNLFIIFIFALIAVFPLLHPGLIPTHDGEYHVVRFYEFNKTLTDGNLYPRWAPDLNSGFGVPLFNYVYPLPNYIASALHLFGISFIDAFKLNMLAAFIIGAIFFYLWARNFWGELGGLVSAVVYSFSPYFFVDIYIRGSVGEVWALGLFPLFLWAVTKAIARNAKLFIPLSGLFLALVIFSHNILAFAFYPFAISYILLLIYLGGDRIIKLKNSLVIILLGLGLSCVFWLPAILERNYVTGLQIFDLKKNFAEIYQLLIPSWGSGFFATSNGNEMSIQIGIVNLLAFIFSFLTGFLFLKRKDKRLKLVLFFWIWFFLLSFLMTKFSSPVWNLPFMNYFQFPWRFLSIVILTTSFLAGSILSIMPSKLLAFSIIFLAFLLSTGYRYPAYYLYRNDSYYITRPNFIDGTNSIGNSFNTIWFKAKPVRKSEKIKLLGKGKINIKELKSNSYKFDVMLPETSRVVVNTAYFPGWTAYVDGRLQKTKIENNGVFSYPLPAGKHSSSVVLEDTFIRKISTYLSSISLLIVLLNILMSVKIKR